MIISPQTDAGRVRKVNEDNFFVEVVTALNGDPIHLFAVADGMGGHANGQDASRIALEQLQGCLLPHLLFFTEDTTDAQIVDCLKQAIQQANSAICKRNHSLRETDAMGTTITAALVVGSVAYVANVGDSRTYLYREGVGLSKITQDHSVVASLVDAGIIKPDDIYTHPRRNEIYRSLGEKLGVEVDTFKVDLLKGDILLLCSDGLWEMVRDSEIERILSQGSHPDEESRALVKAANDKGGEDNITVIVAEALQGGKANTDPLQEQDAITASDTMFPQPQRVPALALTTGNMARVIFLLYVGLFALCFLVGVGLDAVPALGRIALLGVLLQPMLIGLSLLAVPITCYLLSCTSTKQNVASSVALSL